MNTSLHISVASAVKKDRALDVSDMTRLEERMLRYCRLPLFLGSEKLVRQTHRRIWG